MKSRTVRFILYSAALLLIFSLIGIITTIIFKTIFKNDSIIVWFFIALFFWIYLIHNLNKSKNKPHLKNNLALVNTIGALSLLAFYVMHFWNLFKPTGQILFGWPALIGSILLALTTYEGFKERIHNYAKRMKFWKKTFWKRQFHKSVYRVAVRFLPKTGLILIASGVAILIMNSNLIVWNHELKNVYLILILLGVFIWLLTSLSILSAIFISATVKETGKTYEEVEKEMMAAGNIYLFPFFGNNNSFL
jgi:hypothetical protein